MICPHCLVAFHPSWHLEVLGQDIDGDWAVRRAICPTCEKMVVMLSQVELGAVGRYVWDEDSEQFVRPKGFSRRPLPPSVPERFAADFREAVAVLGDSEKASAALSRRCLQNLLREEAGAHQRDLADQIKHVLDQGSLPSYLADDVDAIRNIGNFATHPMKSTATGEIVDVNRGEAEWNLNVLEGLFDFYFVQREAARERRDSLNTKLADLNKPPMKGSGE